MNKKIKIINIIFLIISFITYFFLVIYKNNQYIYNMNYLKCIIYSLIVCLNIYFYSMIINNKNTYKNSILLYIMWFLIILFSFTFIIGRRELKIYNWYYSGQFKIFYTIISQFKHGSIISILKNIFGNIVAIIPLSFLLMIKNKKYNNIIKQSIIILPTILFIELFQMITHTGIFDIDDIILNYLGILIFTFLITRKNIIDKIRKIFYTDYRLKINNKKILYYVSILIYIICVLCEVFI